MNYTENYHLPQWEETERIMMKEFNLAMGKIDEGLWDAAEMPYVIGNYTGTGETLEIDLGFKPRVVMVFKDQLGSYPSPSVGTFIAASEAVTSGDRIVLTEKGFTLAAYSNVLPYPQPNLREDVYTYIAFR